MTDTIYTKLLKAQKEIGAIEKTSNNPFFNSKYADINAFLAVVKPILNKHGLFLAQPLGNVEGKPAITTIILDCESGEKVGESTIILPPPASTKETKSDKYGGTKEIISYDAQKMGSAITYYRRYALQSLLALEAEDDDGAKASGTVKRQAPAKPDFTCTNCFKGNLKKKQSGGLYVVTCSKCDYEKSYPIDKEPTV